MLAASPHPTIQCDSATRTVSSCWIVQFLRWETLWRKKPVQYSVLSLEKLLLCCLTVILPNSLVNLVPQCLTWQLNAYHTKG
jgi:hypothetical protein